MNPSFFFNFVDPSDVVKGMIAASEKGTSGERYILANDHFSSLEKVLTAAKSIDIKVKTSPVFPKWLLYVLSGVLGYLSKHVQILRKSLSSEHIEKARVSTSFRHWREPCMMCSF